MQLTALLSGVILPLVLMGAGGYFFCLLLPCFWKGRGRRTARLRGSSLRSLCVALAGTLGVGNIAGVASAIALGGAGAVFWMWVSALFAMMLKYAEVVLAQRTRRLDAHGRAHGGAPYYIKVAFPGRLGGALAALFALLCVLCSLTLGGVLQSAAAAESMQGAFGIPPLGVGVVMGVLAALILLRGARVVERACSVLVPLVCLVFLALSFAAILRRADQLPQALACVLQSAFSFQSGAAGAFGFLQSRALRYGVARGLVSNEAGCGTAPIAHAAAEASSPAAQGMLGVVEVLVDTVVLCSVSALVLLTSGVTPQAGGGMSYALAAYGATLGKAAAPVLSLSVLIFAFATVLCWAHYGAESLYALTGKAGKPRLLSLLLCAACICGAVAAPSLVWDLTDAVLGVMALLNIAALLALRRHVVGKSQRGVEGE